MKKLITIILLALCVSPVFAEKEKSGVTYDVVLTRVIDGDTIAFQANWLPDPLKKELSLRVFGVDTPEKGFRGQCDSEKQRGEAASVFTKNAIASTQKHQVILYGWDKFGGRVLGDIILNGVSLRAELIKNGFAREYYGDAKQSWCN